MKNLISKKIKYSVIEKSNKLHNQGSVNITKGQLSIDIPISIFNFYEINFIKKKGNNKINEEDSKDFFYKKRNELFKESTSYRQTAYNELNLRDNSSSTYFKKTIFKSVIGELDGNLFFLQEDVDPFKDTQPTQPVYDLIKEDPYAPKYDYPVVFNDKKIHRRGGRIDHFEILEEIKINKSIIGENLGFKPHMLSTGQDQLGFNINIVDKIFRNQKYKSFYYEDDIDEKYIFSFSKENKISKSEYSYEDNQRVLNTTTFQDKVFSTEPRYFINPKEDENINAAPYKDTSINSENYWDYGLKSNSTSTDVNKILLKNRIGNEYSKEDFTYTSRGRDFDYTKSSGVDSIIYHDLED